MINLNGTLYTKNLRGARATDKFFIHKAKKYSLQPHFTYHGYQYIEVTGLKEGVKPDLDLITGYAIASDSKVVGSFESSNPSLNQLWSNVLWTQRDNMISVPTDCPQRNERMGWMGDALAFCQTSIFNMDMAAFYKKWVHDIRDAQTKVGRFTDMVPNPYKTRGLGGFIFQICGIGAPAWADAGVQLPWIVYLNYEDKKLLKEHFKSAKKFIDYLHSKNPNLLWIKRRGADYNDWLNGDEIKSKKYPKKGGEIPKPVFATAFFARLFTTRDPWEAARFATQLSAISVTRLGLGSVPTQDEINNCLVEIL